MPSSPLPTSGATAFAMFDVPDENAIRQPIVTTVAAPASSRRFVVRWTRGTGTGPDRSTSNSGPSLRSIPTTRSIRA
jgi:hypothetical protein